MGPRAGLDGCGKSRLGIRSPDRPARSEWLYRLSCLRKKLDNHQIGGWVVSRGSLDVSEKRNIPFLCRDPKIYVVIRKVKLCLCTP